MQYRMFLKNYVIEQIEDSIMNRGIKYFNLILIFILSMLCITGCKMTRRGNVMEDMYQTLQKDKWDIEYAKVEQLEKIDYDDLHEFENFGGLSIPYKQKYLKDNYKIKLFIPTEKEEIEIHANVKVSETMQANVFMTYNHESKTLTMEPLNITVWKEGEELASHFYDKEHIYQYIEDNKISESDIREYQKYILYDVVLQTWIQRDDKKRKLCEDDYRYMNIVDNTFLLEE